MDHRSKHVDLSPAFSHDRIEISSPSRKRARKFVGHTKIDSDELLGRATNPNKRPPGSRTLDDKPSLACPFRKLDPAKYKSCHNRLTRPRDVKQHLRRCHIRPPYCAICYETFKTTGARDSHSRMGCKLRDSEWFPDGISEERIEELSKRPPKEIIKNDEAQWFWMFDILFPGHQPRPKSAYVDVQSEDLDNFEAFLMIDGPRIIADCLRVSGHALQGCEQEIHRGLQAVFCQWRGEGDFIRELTTTSGSGTLRDTPSIPSPASKMVYSPPMDVFHGILLQQDAIPEPPAANLATQMLAPSMYPMNSLEAIWFNSIISSGAPPDGRSCPVTFGDPQFDYQPMEGTPAVADPHSTIPSDRQNPGQM